MRTLQVLLPLLAWISCVVATSEDLLFALKNYPPCGLNCLTASVTQSPCTLTDTACICANQQIQTNVTACVRSTCTIKESLNTQNISAILCHYPVRDVGRTTRISNILCTVMTNVVAWPRLIYRVTRIRPEVGLDDAMVLLSLVIGVPSVIIIDRKGVPNGLGRDVWTLNFDNITNFSYSLYHLEWLYFLQLAISKLALLFFCLRIFPKPIIRKLLWATVAFTTAWGIATALASVFQCLPIRNAWTTWDLRARPAGCLNIHAVGWSNAGISIGLDIWMLLLPLSEVFKLQLSWRRKFGAAIMFGVGLFVTIVSVIRIWSLFAANHINPSWEQAHLVFWSSIEVNVGVMCACLPTWRLMILHYWKKWFPSPRQYNTVGGGERKKKSSKQSQSSTLNSSAFGSSMTKSQVDANELKDKNKFELLPVVERDEERLMHVSQFRASLIQLEPFQTEQGHGRGEGAEDASSGPQRM